MPRFPRAAALTAALALPACASGGGGTGSTPDPILDASGDVAAPRNLVLEEISFRSGADGRGVDETYDLAMRTLIVGTAPNGARTYEGQVRAGFEAGQSMSYDAATNTFSFAIDHADTGDDGTGPRVVMNETFGPLLLVRPNDFDGLEGGVTGIYLFAQPAFFGSLPRFATLAEADAYVAALADLEEDDIVGGRRVADIRAALTLGVERVEANPGFVYAANGVRYFQYRTDGAVAPTRFVAAGEFDMTDADGNERYSHLVFGQRTDPAEMPQTGTARYEGTIYGNMVRQNDVQTLRGGFDMETDFATGDLTMTMDANIAYRNGEGVTEFIDYATFGGTGDIDGAAFSGVMDGTVDRGAGDDAQDVLTGTFDGEFFGPTAQEAGGTFEFTGADAVAAGAFVAADPDSNTSGN